MPKFDKTAPSGSKGPRDGKGKGKGLAPGKGVGLMAGGQQGLFNKWKVSKKK